MAVETISINRISEITGLDRRTVKKYLTDQGVELIGKEYPLHESWRATVQAKKGQNSADRKNDAQAEKAEVETLILRRKFWPAEQFMKVIRPIFMAISKHIENSEMEDELKESLIQIIHEGVQFNIEEFEEDADE